MPSATPPRRFAPEPVETTSRSSRSPRQQSPDEETTPKARCFAPEPIETSTKSSRRPEPAQEEPPKPRRFAPQPVETTTKSSRQRNEQVEEPVKKPRRFAPEPVETTQKSSKDRAQQNEKPAVRRFAPQLEETSRKSSKGRSEPDKGTGVRFLPQPVETTYRSNRKPNGVGKEGGRGEEPVQKAPRKFAPILLDTARRSRRSGGDYDTAWPEDLKTESGHLLHAREHRKHLGGDVTPIGEGGEALDFDALNKDTRLAPSQPRDIRPELRRQLSPMDGSTPARQGSISSLRSHSFRCPELDTIESSESEEISQDSSLSSSPGQGSPITASDSSFNGTFKHATRIRESVDETFSQYLLQLEAKKAEQRLRDQALAAFPNSDFHEPVDHYITKEDDSDDMEIEDRPVTWADYEDDLLLQMAARRESTVKISWEQLEMQRHAEKLEQERNAAKTTAKQPSASPWWNENAAFGLGQPDPEMSSMRDRARPPMLGSDLVFPRCRSPEPARFDVTQGSTTLRNQMCYLTEHAEAEKRRTGEEEGLWQPPKGQPVKSPQSTVTSPKAASPTSPTKGLWGGYCVDDGEERHQPNGFLAAPTGQTGLMTPAVEQDVNPFDQSFAVSGVATAVGGPGLKTPQTPPRSLNLQGINGVLNAEQELDEVMEREFPDSFITQVYNYLSLGYPSLARPFDEELSKISRIPISDLRRNDKKARETPRGYIRLGPDFEGGGGEGLTEQDCMRWQALKSYVREWARQEKNMVKHDGPGGNWGTGARRGSWAI
jgi:hypothetical protein